MGLGPTVDRTCGLGPERGVDLEGDVEDVVPGAGLDELFGLSEHRPLPSLAGWMLSAGWVQVRSGAAGRWPEKAKGRRDVPDGIGGPWSRSEARRVGQEWVSTCSTRWSPTP